MHFRPRRGWCGIPSTWHRPTTRRPGGSPRRTRTVPRAALPLGCRVVALREVVGMPHPAATTSPPLPRTARPSRRPAARRGHEHFGVNADGVSRRRPGHAALYPLTCGVMSSRAALCRRLPDGALRVRSDQTAGQAPSRRPGAVRSRSGRRATRRHSKLDHARLALRPERDSPLGGRRGDAYPLAPPCCSCRSSTTIHLGDLPARRGRPLLSQAMVRVPGLARIRRSQGAHRPWTS